MQAETAPSKSPPRIFTERGAAPPLLFLKLVFLDHKTPAAAPCFAIFKAWALEAMNSWILS